MLNKGLIFYVTLGEKYLGSWNNNAKHGSGLIVTLDGIYYEGVFVQDVFMVVKFPPIIIDFCIYNLSITVILGSRYYGPGRWNTL